MDRTTWKSWSNRRWKRRKSSPENASSTSQSVKTAKTVARQPPSGPSPTGTARRGSSPRGFSYSACSLKGAARDRLARRIPIESLAARIMRRQTKARLRRRMAPLVVGGFHSSDDKRPNRWTARRSLRPTPDWKCPTRGGGRCQRHRNRQAGFPTSPRTANGCFRERTGSGSIATEK